MRFLKEENIEAYFWYKNGDHPKDDCETLVSENGSMGKGEGHIVGYYPYLDDKDKICALCEKPFSDHGKIGIDLLFEKIPGHGPVIICPGTWIRTHNIAHIKDGPEKYSALFGFDTRPYGGVKCMEAPKVEDLQELKAKLLFHVKINKNYCPVYSIDGRHHYGRENGDIDSWWIQWGSSGEMFPYSDRFTNRICYEYNFREFNSAKMKWDELRISKGVAVNIMANDKPFLSFSTRDMEFAMAKAQYTIVQAMEHPYDFLEPQKELNRKIWYYGLPALVKPSSEPGEIGIIPDYSTGIDKQKWWKLFKERRLPVNPTAEEIEDDIYEEEGPDSSYISHGSALWDGMINWFRKDPVDDKPVPPDAQLTQQ